MIKVSLYKRYGFWGLMSLIRSKLYTMCLYPSARIIRLPFYLRGYKWVGLGKGLTTGVGCRIEAIPAAKLGVNEKIITIGDNVQINDYVHIAGVNKVAIGNNVLIASRVFISDHNHGVYAGSEEHSSPDIAPETRIVVGTFVVISENVWIGESVSILPGVTIGKGSIVGANSLVSKDIPPYSIAVGVPARVIKTYNFEKKTWDSIKK